MLWHGGHDHSIRFPLSINAPAQVPTTEHTMDLSVKYEPLQLSQQLLERQATVHLTKMKSFVGEWCRLQSGDDIGLAFKPFIPVNDAITTAGEETLELLKTCHQGVADKLGDTVNAYVEADKAAYEALAPVIRALGGSAEPFVDPRTNPAQLGESVTKAGAKYGGGDPILDEQLQQDVGKARDYATDVKRRTVKRGQDAISSDRSISESQDASSFLVPPEAPQSEMENVRWSAGPIVGGVDWAIERMTGVSLLNDVIFKYLAGDWRHVTQASSAWSEIGDALVAVGQNGSEVLPALSEWTGKGSELTNAFITALSLATTKLKDVAGVLATALKAFAFVVKQAAELIGKCINAIVTRALRIVAEGSVPVAGWVAAAAETVLLVNQILQMIRKIYAVINFIVDSIEGLVQAKTQLLEVGDTLSNIAEAAARGIAARV